MRTWSRTGSRTSVRTFDRTESGGLPPVVSDPDFEYTTLLLPGNGTNGAQNNTFLDSSTNAFSITRNGNTTQGTFSPFSQTGWGVYFNGSSDYISVADSADFTMGSGDFTIQCWVYSTANSGSDQYILGQVPSTGAAASTSFQLYKKATTNVAECYVYIGGSKVATSTATIPVGQWTHLAMVRDGGTMRLYVNGSQDGTNATLSTSSIVDSTGSFSVGRTGDYNGLYFAGYVSNVSVVKGTCLFPNGTTFTPSTTPLSTSTSGQSVLLCQANRFIDTNTATTAKTVTVGSTSSIQAFSPFNPTAAWSAATYGGSGYFDGSGDNLITPTNAALDFGSGNFTIDFWVYPTAFAAYQIVVGTRPDANNYTTAYSIGYTNAGTLFMYTNGFVAFGAAGALRLSEWNYVAVTRAGTTIQFYVNGVSSGTAGTNSQSFSGYPVRINGNGDGSEQFTGYVSSVRVIKGTAITPTLPTAPLTAITNTQLLLNFTNAGIYDATSKNDLETVGNAQISTTQSKFGGSSMYFDGTGDGLLAPSTSRAIQFGTGAYTVEFWLYMNSVSGNQGLVTSAGGSGTGPIMALRSGKLASGIFGSADTITSTTTLSTGQWYHVAYVRDSTGSNATRIYLNGVLDATGTISTDFSTAQGVAVGYTPTASEPANCYIDDLRITRGVARYTTGFTPPSTAFPLL
jgi:hypothetical protein